MVGSGHRVQNPIDTWTDTVRGIPEVWFGRLHMRVHDRRPRRVYIRSGHRDSIVKVDNI